MPRANIRSTQSRRRRTYVPRSQARSSAVALARRTPMYLNPASRGVFLRPGEFKSIDVGPSGVSVNSFGQLYLMNGCIRGNSIDTRVGQRIMMRSIQFMYTFNTDPTSLEPQRLRVFMVYDRQANGSFPLLADIFETVGTTNFRKLENRSRFNILFDKTYMLNVNPNTPSTGVQSYYKRLSLPVTYSSEAGIGNNQDIMTGSLWFGVVSSVGIDEHPPTVFYNTRVRFQDF